MDDVITLPKVNSSELILHLKPVSISHRNIYYNKVIYFNCFQNDANVESVRQIKIAGQKDILIWLHDKIEQAIIVSTEEKSWPAPEPH